MAAAWGAFKLTTWEIQTSTLQSRHFAEAARAMRYWVDAGPSSAIRFPDAGPHDERLGYTRIPKFAARLSERDFRIARQARHSPELLRLIDRGYFPPYREKTQAGLGVLDCRGEPLFAFSAPQRVYASFDDIPPVIVRTLLFIENRELLDDEHPNRNPAVEWDRLAVAAASRALRLIDPDREAPGGSTLATQIEKYRHSPEGLTASTREKFRQMYSATMRAYREGEDTRGFRRQLILDYLNSVPLSASPGFGEVNGLGDALWSRYGTSFEEANRLLRGLDGSGPVSADQARAYRQALGLMVAQRRPSHYLGAGEDALAALVDSHLRLLAREGYIPPALRDAALRERDSTRLRREPSPIAPVVAGKAASAVRVRLSALLDVPRLYELDRLDLVAASTLDARLQSAVEAHLRRLQDPEQARAAGLVGPHLLERGDPAGLFYSFTLYERAGGANLLRVQTDSAGRPFDINEGAKLELGSTAKLRTLASYLDIVAALHERYGALDRAELAQADTADLDRLSRWAIGHLAESPDRSLEGMLSAALERRYSANPAEAFFTGGGQHTFENFRDEDDGRNPTVLEAFRESINLPFVRIMRDVVQYHAQQLTPDAASRILRDPNHPQRAELLERFAEREGRQFVRHFLAKYRGLSPEASADLLVRGIRPTPERLAVIFRALDPQAGPEALDRFLAQHLPNRPLSASELASLHARHAPGRYSLQDQGYLARLHPLELWVASELHRNPHSDPSKLLEASLPAVRESYEWLFRARVKSAQNSRIQMMLESRAFEEIHRAWKRLGYPFDYLVPSLATAIGSSGDRPAALAELMGIIINDGMRLPVARIERLNFAAGTPYETVMDFRPADGEGVMRPAVAAALRGALTEVVAAGTARRVGGAFDTEDGRPVPVGGKTGTGDNRHETYGPGGNVLSSRALNRTATFAFFIGERHFGVITAYAPGPKADEYRFTSALPTQILKTLAPILGPSIHGEAAEPCANRASEGNRAPAMTAAGAGSAVAGGKGE